MLAEYQASLAAHGPSFYRRLFREAGAIGQVLYLEAEAAGVRSTGIGCFFDDPVHQAFGLKDLAFQSLYHFTVGGAVDDPRLTTLPAYGRTSHPKRGSRVGSCQGSAWNLSVSDILKCEEPIAPVKRFWTWMGRPWSSTRRATWRGFR